MHRWFVAITVTAVAVAACTGGGKSASPDKDSSMRTYKLVPANNPSSPPISVSLAVPSGWKENASNPSTVMFDVPGLASGSLVSLTAIELTGTPAAQMTKAIDIQGLSDGQRSDLSGGRVWIQKTQGAIAHGRVFAPYAGGVVMAVALIQNGADRLPDLRKVFETLTVAAP